MKQHRLTISLEADDYRRLCVLARTEDRSLSWLVGRALRAFLDEHAVPEQLVMPDRPEPTGPKP
ncbi:MAG: CopG family transcriptional regulator [Acidobacteria bacterium]|nr:CopG family transcriptional regulator [Acidobacteriota bacterium]